MAGLSYRGRVRRRAAMRWLQIAVWSSVVLALAFFLLAVGLVLIDGK